MKTKLKYGAALVAIYWTTLFGFSGCVTHRENKCHEKWEFPDSKYRVVHKRWDREHWQVWQYTGDYWTTLHIKNFAKDLLDGVDPTREHHMVIERRP